MRIEAGALCPPNGLADLLWRYGRAIEFDFERTERVRDRVRECSRRTYRSTFTNTLNAERIKRDGEDVAVVEEASGRIGVAKVLTTPGDLAAGVLHALQSAVHRYDVVNTEVALLSHATTVVTNAILEEKGARAALITTRGFRDVLELRPSRAKATSAVCRIATAPKDTA
jgi:hypothetical protein